jgi:hypothetical protein
MENEQDITDAFLKQLKTKDQGKFTIITRKFARTPITNLLHLELLMNTSGI